MSGSGNSNAGNSPPSSSGTGTSSSPTPAAANTIPATVFTTVPVDLFRMGNASGPRLNNIRVGRDVVTEEEVFSDGTRKTMVLPNGGLSTFDSKNPSLSGTWWRIPAGVVLPETIRVVKDRGAFNAALGRRITHYSLRPARKMTLEEYAEGLKTLAASAVQEPKPMTASTADPDEKRPEAVAKK